MKCNKLITQKYMLEKHQTLHFVEYARFSIIYKILTMRYLQINSVPFYNPAPSFLVSNHSRGV